MAREHDGAYRMDAPRGGATRRAFIPYMLHYPFYHWWEGSGLRPNDIYYSAFDGAAGRLRRRRLYDEPVRERLRTFVLG
jgi:hypothetical protein